MENTENHSSINEATTPLKLSEKIGYGLGDTASCLYYNTFAMFLMYFYTDVYGLAPAVVGTMFLVTRIWDTFNDPLMGILTDRTKTKNGTFRPWLRWMLIPFMIAGILTFYTPDWNMTAKIIYAYVTYTFVGMAYTAINIPYSALMGVMSSDGNQRTILSSWRFIGAFSGNIIVQFSLLRLVSFFGNGNEKIGFFWSFVVFALMAGGMFLTTYYTTKERIAKPKNQENNLKADFSELLKNGPWLALCLVGVLTLIWISIKSAAIIYYFKYYVGNQDGASTFMWTGSIFTILGITLTKQFTSIFGGKKRAYLFLNVITAITMFAFFFVKPESTISIYALHLLGSFFSGPLLPLTWAMFADTADYAEWKFRRRSTGLIFSAGTFSQKFGWTIGGAIAGWLLAFYNFEANAEQSADSLKGIVLLMSIIPAIGAVIAGIAALIYKIDDKLEKQMQAELAERRAES